MHEGKVRLYRENQTNHFLLIRNPILHYEKSEICKEGKVQGV